MLDLSTLLFMSCTIDLQRGTLVYSNLDFVFVLLLNSPMKGLLDEIPLDDSNLCIAPGVPSNILSRIQYTAMDNFDFFIN